MLLRQGIESLIASLKARGIVVYLISGGFRYPHLHGTRGCNLSFPFPAPPPPPPCREQTLPIDLPIVTPPPCREQTLPIDLPIVTPPPCRELTLPIDLPIVTPPPCRELTLPIAERLGIPLDRVFANRMLWQVWPRVL